MNRLLVTLQALRLRLFHEPRNLTAVDVKMTEALFTWTVMVRATSAPMHATVV